MLLCVMCCSSSSSRRDTKLSDLLQPLLNILCAPANCLDFAGDVLGLQQQLEVVSERLIGGMTQLEGVSSSGMRRLEEQATTLADAVAVRGPWCCCYVTAHTTVDVCMHCLTLKLLDYVHLKTELAG